MVSLCADQCSVVWCGGAVDPACHARPASGGGLARLLPEFVWSHQHHTTLWASTVVLWLGVQTPVTRVPGSILPPGGGRIFLSRMQRMSHHQQPMGEEKRKRRRGKGNRKEPVEAPHWCTWSGDQILPSHWPSQTKPIGW